MRNLLKEVLQQEEGVNWEREKGGNRQREPSQVLVGWGPSKSAVPQKGLEMSPDQKRLEVQKEILQKDE